MQFLIELQNPLILTWILWILFWSYWRLIALKSDKPDEAKEPWSRRARYGIIILASFAVLAIPPGYWNVKLFHTYGWNWFWLVVQILGFALAVLARMHLGQYWSGRITIKEGHKIIQTGPYGWMRHPIYTGLLLQMLGSSLVIGTLLALLGVPLMYIGCRIKIVAEETSLLQYFGQEYAEYQQYVPGAVIPGFQFF